MLATNAGVVFVVPVVFCFIILSRLHRIFCSSYKIIMNGYLIGIIPKLPSFRKIAQAKKEENPTFGTLFVRPPIL